MTIRTTRRRLLLSGLGAGVVAVTRPWRTFIEFEETPSLERLSQVLRADEATYRVGLSYLRAFPDHANEELLLDMITSALGVPASARPSELARGALSAIENEFRARNTVRLDGWVAAPTEARLAALVTLASTEE